MKKVLSFFIVLVLVTTATMNAQQRKVLFEEFTSSTCYPYCPQYNQLINPWLADNANKVVVVKYQMNFPGAGDPYYTSEGNTRRSYYKVGGVPDAYVNGSQIGGSSVNAIYNNTVTAINNGYTQPAEAVISGYFRVSGTMIYVKTSVTPLITGDNYFIHCVVNEKTTTGNIGSNGEKIFYHVMMKMFPNGSGTTLSLTQGETINLSFSHNMSTTHVEEMSDLEVAVFVQNKSTKAVLNAEYLTESNTIPLPPTNFLATQQGGGLNIKLTWDQVSGADGYNIFRDGVKVNTTPITGTSFTDEVTKYNVTYNYKINATVGGIESFDAATTCLPQVPKPINVTATQVRGTKMKVTWELPEGVEVPVKYYVYRNNVFQNSGNPLDTTTYESTGSYNVEYCFDIASVINGITGAKSAKGCVTLINVPTPTNLKAEQVSSSSKDVRLTWNKSETNTVGYNIYRDGVKINTELVTDATYLDNVPEDQKEYLYLLYGVAENGGESANAASATVEVILGINEPAQEIFTLYPNPVSGKLFINSDETILNCNVFNLQGQLIYSSKSDVKEIDTDGWAQNVYIIQIQTHKGLSEKRFVKR